MDIALITDSTCDLGPAAEIAYGIDIVPLTVSFANAVFRDGVDITGKAFYAKLSKSSTLPTTSQPSPAAFREVFRRRLAEGKEVIALLLSSMISGTYQSAQIAKDECTAEEQERIHLVDTKNTTGCLGIIVLEAVRLRDAGYGVDAILAHVRDLSARVVLYAALDTLRYLRMGGRLSAAAAAAGSILNIVPIATVTDGAVAVAAKIRKSQSAFRKWLRDRLNRDLPDPDYPAIFLHSGDQSVADQLQEEFKYLLPQDKIYRLAIGAVIGTHAGPGASGLCYVIKANAKF